MNLLRWIYKYILNLILLLIIALPYIIIKSLFNDDLTV